MADLPAILIAFGTMVSVILNALGKFFIRLATAKLIKKNADD
ncbi:hypothetical protein WOSG25_070120 [Weissella oryzae SG25]|uniref:Uncharacterized protein n=1 Tax=Weissella oryzae (strain DSM 25784 / JCM 18191 / LMG 30913 / SG25) TaxID=1329250 RepID=A0A069CT97_WEIOS|nr:hypothetical protein [Weissella oryzae]GAK31035.1 hypothetical protein WOSG25_070120 [Weissella oryzae SG25]